MSSQAVSEIDAMRLWCPFIRNGHSNNTSGTERIPPWAFCVGSKCMAWRPTHTQIVKGENISVGYCGLAGAKLSR